ncbi:unnamed protein product [Onchocerca ochengi]|uniref:Serine protease n=1 Tax=Onchocerca ochengi TaxID=42157 RepID=A0A182EWU0_ONCOC|nr:unnamed protein product [Onchocerca ochengi]
MLVNVGLNPTINYTVQGYKPDNVIIATDITQGQIWSRDTGACVVKDNIVIAFVNGSRYDKAISIKLHNIEFPLTYNFWKEAGAVFARYLKNMSKVLIYKMYVEV